MRVGLIVEGLGDHAIISNILKGLLGLTLHDIEYLRPSLSRDETDKHTMRPEQYGNYALVIEDCKEGSKINAFINFEGNEFIVVHLDLAEHCNYELSLPEDFASKDRVSQCKLVHSLLVNQIEIWTGGRYKDCLCHALAAQETEAWLLAIHEKDCEDTSVYLDPKRRFRENTSRRVFTRSEHKRLAGLSEQERSSCLSLVFRRRKDLLECAQRNFSLRFLCEELEKFALR